MAQFFTFEDFRDRVIKPDYDKGMIEYEGDVSLGEVAEACLILYVHEGMLLKEVQGGNAVYVRTQKKLPPPRVK